MKRRTWLQLGLGLGANLYLGPAALAAKPQAESDATSPGAMSGNTPLQWRSRTLHAMGTTMTFRVAHAHAAQAERALDAAVADIRALEDQMSLFRPDSAISQLNRSGVLRNPPPDLLAVLRLAHTVSQRSQGAFDVTVQPLWRVFEAAQQQGRLPAADAIASARQQVDWRAVQLSPEAIRLARPGMAITLNGIAQGYAADKVKARLHQMGIAHALVDAGEWAALGQPAHAGDWTLGIADPRPAPHQAPQLLAAVALQGRCMATSADNACSFSADRAHHHIFDPRTGYSPAELASVSVLAPSAALADALTKVFFMAGYARALPLAKAWGVEVLVVDKRGRWQASPGLARAAT